MASFSALFSYNKALLSSTKPMLNSPSQFCKYNHGKAQKYFPGVKHFEIEDSSKSIIQCNAPKP